MKKIFLVILFLAISIGLCFAQELTLEQRMAALLDNEIKNTYWVLIQTKDKSNVAVDPLTMWGLSNKGDVIETRPVIPGHEPTPTEQEEYMILKADLTEYESQVLILPYYETDTEDGRNGFDVPKAFRKNKIDFGNMGLIAKKGLIKQKKKIKIKKITQNDISRYQWNRRKYVYLIRPWKLARNRVVTYAHASDNIKKICATGSNCTDEDYNSVDAWESAVDGDQVSATTRQIGELYDDDGDINDSWTIAGSTVNDTYYMFLRAGTGEEHNGDYTTGASTSQAGTFDYAGVISDDYTRLQGFRLVQDNYVYYGILRFNSGANNILLNRMFLANTQTWGGQESIYTQSLWCNPACDFTAENTAYALESSSTGFARLNGSFATYALYGSTVFGESSSERTICGNSSSTCDIYTSIVWNFDVANCDNGDYNCLSDSNTCGANDLASQSAGDIDFTDTTENAWDLHIEDTSTCVDNGNDYSASMTNDEDIDIEVRTGTWESGADNHPDVAEGMPLIIINLVKSVFKILGAIDV